MPVKIFCCYAHEDEPLLKKLKTHLFPLQRAGLVDVWYDRDISAGTDWEQQIKERLNTAHIILLLVSPDFMASDYCYSIEMQRAIERHELGEAHVIPIILRPVYWQDVLGKLQALPTDGLPVMSSGWPYQDEAFVNVTEGIRKVVGELHSNSSLQQTITPDKAATETPILRDTIRAYIDDLGDEVEDLRDEGEIMGIDSFGDPEVSHASSAVFLTPLEHIHQIAPSILGKLIRRDSVHTLPVTGIAWSPNGAYIASTSYDGTMRIWDATTGYGDPELEISIPNAHPTQLYMSGLAWSPNGTYIATATSTAILQIWAIAKSQLIEYGRFIAGRNEYANSQQLDMLNWSPDEKAIAFRVFYDGTWPYSFYFYNKVQVWHMDKPISDVAYSNHRSYDRNTTQITSLAWSPNSQRIASTSRNVQIWNAANGITECTFHDSTSDWVTSVTWSPDGRYTASASFDKTVQIWDTQTGGHVFTYEGHHLLRKGKVQIVAWSPIGKYIASVSDKIIQVWSVPTRKLIYTYQGHSSKVKAISWSPDGQRIASIGDGDNRVHVWRAITGDNPFLYTGHTDKVLGMSWL